MTDRFVDTSVFVLAAGGDHPDREPCRALIAKAAKGDVRLHASVEAVQEFVFHRMRRVDRPTALAETQAMSRGLVLHAFDVAVSDASLRLMAGSTLRGRDAVHAATATLAGFDTIISLDADFDEPDIIQRIHPAHT